MLCTCTCSLCWRYRLNMFATSIALFYTSQWMKEVFGSFQIVIHVVGMKLLHVSYHQEHMKRRSVHLEFIEK